MSEWEAPENFLKNFSPYYIYKLYVQVVYIFIFFYRKFDFCERLGQGLLIFTRDFLLF